MSYKNFVSDIKADIIGNLVLIYGQENLLIRWCMNEIINKYAGEEYRTENVLDVEGSEANIDELIGRALTPSMFPGKRVIIVRNLPMLFKKTAEGIINTQGNRLLDFANMRGLDAYIVLTLDAKYNGELTAFGKKLAGKASSYNCERLSLPELKGFINKRIKAAGKYLAPRQLDHIIDLTGYTNKESDYSLDILENDLNKLINMSDETDITNEMIESIMVRESDLFVFNFIDAVVGKRHEEAMRLVVEMLEKDEDSAMQLISLVTSQLEMMFDAKQMDGERISVPEMAKMLGVNEYRFKKAYRASTQFTEYDLKQLLISLYNIDHQIKTGAMDKSLALETFVLKVCPKEDA